MNASCAVCKVPIKQGFPTERGGLTCTLLDDKGRCLPIRPKKPKQKR